jgi:hypothetical protein
MRISYTRHRAAGKVRVVENLHGESHPHMYWPQESTLAKVERQSL